MKNVEWGEFKLGDLFEIATGRDVIIGDVQNGNIPLISHQHDNNGISKKIAQLSNRRLFNFENTLPLADRGVFLATTQNENFHIGTRVKALTFKDGKKSLKIRKFIVACINKLQILFLDYASNATDNLPNLKIQLPTKNNKIDFEFIESFIAELEAERLAELEAYLITTGLKDYTLTAEEQKALDDFEKMKFEEFNVIDVFVVKNTGNILSRDIIENSGVTPYLCASAENNAVSSYISFDEKLLDKGNCVFIGGKTFVVTYQEKYFYSNDSHNLVLYLKNEEKRSKLNQLYLATCINKSLKHKYSWGDSVSNTKIKKDKVSLPTENKQPNYAIMETLISAIQKLVIKDVVLYADSKIDETRKTGG